MISGPQFVQLPQTVQPETSESMIANATNSARLFDFLIMEIEIISILNLQSISFIAKWGCYKLIEKMGNKAQQTAEQQSAADILNGKNEVEFRQIDFIREIEGSIEEEYEVLSPCLEQNQFYELRKVIHIKTRLVRAVYIVNKYKIRSHERELFEDQIRKLKKIDHPAVPKIYELFKNSHRFFVVMEYKQGQSLAAVLQSQRYFEEASAASIVWQLLALLTHCHKRGITHTDLKLTSILFNSKKQDTIKVMDFSISKIFRIEEIIEQSIGRVVLSAPETIANQTTSKSDIWSVGVILYILLCGEPPIIANSKIKLIHKFKSFFIRFKQKRFKQVSDEGKDIIRRMLKINPNQRPSAEQLMENFWFSRYMKLPRLPQNTLKRTLKELYFYNPSSKLQEATWTFFVNSLISYDEKQMIMGIFISLDRGSKGELDENDLYQGFLQIFEDEKKAQSYSKRVINRHRRPRILFSEFLTCCANRFFLIRQANLVKIFEIFDEDGSGEIEISELRDTLGNSKQLTEQVWLELVREANASTNGKLSFEDFSHMIRQLNLGTLNLDPFQLL